MAWLVRRLKHWVSAIIIIIGIFLFLASLAVTYFAQWSDDSAPGNCAQYAFKKFWEDQDSYVVMRWSLYGPWLHVLHTADFQTFTEFVPPSKRKHFFPPILFRGKVKTWACPSK